MVDLCPLEQSSQIGTCARRKGELESAVPERYEDLWGESYV